MEYNAKDFLQLDRKDISPTTIFMLGFARRAEAREQYIQTLQAQLDSQAIPDPKLIEELEAEKQLLKEDRYGVRCLLNPDADQQECNKHPEQTPYFGQ